jgi:hypothetical protein
MEPRVPRRPSIRQQVKEILEAREGYEYALWKCTGRHRLPIVVLGGTWPERCGHGHPFKFVAKVPVSKALKSYVKRLLSVGQSE